MSPRHDDNTYFIDPNSEAELARLIKQDQLLNAHTDLLPREFVPWKDATVLDLACGPGTWALEVADRFPIVRVAAIDIDPSMVAYAQAQAQVRIEDRVEFQEGNILNPLDFPDASFDFINARFLAGLMHTSFWEPLIRECLRVSRPNGIIRLTETGARAVSSSPHAEKFHTLLMECFWKVGMNFSARDPGITPMLGVFLEHGGFRVLNEVPYLLNLSYGTPWYEGWQKSAPATLQLICPFILQHSTITEEALDALCQHTISEIRSPMHREQWFVVSVIAQKDS